MRSITGVTRLMAVIGDPVQQITTPSAINPIFDRLGVDIICVPMHIPADSLTAAWAGMQAIRNLAGLGVTLPHKKAVAALCDRLDERAQLCDAVNAVRRTPEGEMVGGLFDGMGLVEGLRKQGHSPQDQEVLLVGAGGAAIAVAFELVKSGVSRLVVANRTVTRARRLVEKINDACGSERVFAGDADPRGYSLVVNCTSLGLRADDPLPIDLEHLAANTVVADIVAKPKITKLLHAAQQKGCIIHPGFHMIEGQAELIATYLR